MMQMSNDDTVLVMSQTTYDHITSRSNPPEKERFEKLKEEGSIVVVDHVQDFRYFNMKKEDALRGEVKTE